MKNTRPRRRARVAEQHAREWRSVEAEIPFYDLPTIPGSHLVGIITDFEAWDFGVAHVAPRAVPVSGGWVLAHAYPDAAEVKP